MDVNVNVKEVTAWEDQYIIDIDGKVICKCSSKVVADYIQELILNDFDFNNEDYKVTMQQKLLES